MWEKSGGRPFKGEGVTRDISLKGAYILSATCPPVKATVHVEILLPQISIGVPSARITAKMRTQRVDRVLSGQREKGFSIVGKGFVLRRLS
jgi:hypothetical protein